VIVARIRRSRPWAFALSMLLWIAAGGFAVGAVVFLALSLRDGADGAMRVTALMDAAVAFACATPALLLQRYARSAGVAWRGAWQPALSQALVQQNRLLRFMVGILVACAGALVLAFLLGVG